jgi:hypothetical protein
MAQCHRRQASATSAGNPSNQAWPRFPSRSVVASTRPAGTSTLTTAAYEERGRPQRVSLGRPRAEHAVVDCRAEHVVAARLRERSVFPPQRPGAGKDWISTC